MQTRKLQIVATFSAGLIVGALFVGGLLLSQRPGQAASSGKGHIQYAAAGSSWNQTATLAVNDLKAKGIIVAPKGAAYNGNAYVTRFEAAVLIDRFVHYIETGRKPLHPTMLNGKQMPQIESGPAHTEMVDLVKNRYIVVNSPLLTPPGTKQVTTNELSEAMATTVIRVVDRDLAPVNNGEQEE